MKTPENFDAEQNPHPNFLPNPHEIQKERSELRVAIGKSAIRRTKDKKEAVGYFANNIGEDVEEKVEETEKPKSLEEVLAIIRKTSDSLEIHGSLTDDNMARLKHLDEEAKKFAGNKQKLRDMLVPFRKEETDQKKAVDNLLELDTAKESLLVRKYKLIAEVGNLNGTAFQRELDEIERTISLITQTEAGLLSSPETALLYRKARMLEDRDTLASLGFVMTESRQKDYQFLLEQNAKRERMILLWGPPGSGKTEYVRQFAQDFLGEEPIKITGDKEKRISELAGKEGLRRAGESDATETYHEMGKYEEAIKQADRLGKAVIHFDEWDLTPTPVQMWWKDKVAEMKRRNITLIATGNMTEKGGREKPDPAVEREFSPRRIDYMPKEELFHRVVLPALMDRDGGVKASPNEINEVVKIYTEAVVDIQRNFTKRRTEGEEKLEEIVVDTGMTIKFLKGFYGQTSLYNHLCKSITEDLTHRASMNPKKQRDIDLILNIFRSKGFDVPGTNIVGTSTESQEIQRLKQVYSKAGYTTPNDLAQINPYGYLKEIESKDELQTQGIQKEIEKRLKEAREQRPRTVSRIESPEILDMLDRDCELQERVHRESGLLESLSNGSEGIMAIDGIEYPFPTKEEVESLLVDNLELLEKKISQYQKPRIIITAFGLPILKVAESWKKVINELKDELHNRDGSKVDSRVDPNDSTKTLYDITPNSTENNKAPVWVWKKYTDQDNILYDPKEFHPDKAKNQAKTKQEILGQIGGYTVTLQDDIDSPRAGTGQEKNNRKPLECGKTPNQYLELLQAAANQTPNQNQDITQYVGETGLYPEEVMQYCITRLLERDKDGRRGEVAYNYNKPDQSLLYSLGAMVSPKDSQGGVSAFVPALYWFSDYGQFVLYGLGPGASSGAFGTSSSVRFKRI